MKNVRKVLCLWSIALMIVITNVPVKAQDDIAEIIKAGPQDVATYLDYYLTPMFQSFSYGMNSGWYNTAKPHSSLGFDLTFSLNLAMVPKGEDMFLFQNSEYSNIRLQSGSQAEVATLFGPDESGSNLEVVDDNVVLSTFGAPGGLGISDYTAGFMAMPAPTLNLGLGIIKNTEIKIRYVPDVSKDVDYSLWGVGIMHDWGQWIPVINKLPIDLSVFGAYSKLSLTRIFEETGIESNGTEQGIQYDQTGLTLEALVSKKLSVLTVYGGLGINTVKTETSLLGTWVIDSDDYTPVNPPPGYVPPTTIINEGDIKLDTDGSSFHATIGLRLKLAVFTIHGQYAYNGYNTLSAGLGLSFR